MQSVREALEGFEELVRPVEGGGAPGRFRVNGHIHLPPNFSAFDTVGEAVELAAGQGLDVLGASNYYDFSAYGEFLAACRARGIYPLLGTEIICMVDELARAGVKINDPGNPGKMYLCGKGITRIDPMSPRAAELMGRIRRNDDARMAEMVDKLAGHFATRGVETGLTAEQVVARVVRRHGCPAETVTLQERHVAQAFQERFFELVPAQERAAVLARVLGDAPTNGAQNKWGLTPFIGQKWPWRAGNEDFGGKMGSDPIYFEETVGVQGAMRSGLMKAGKGCFVAEAFVSFAEAKELVGELGGIGCYPVLADGAGEVCAFEAPVERLIDNLRERGVHCAELIPGRNRLEVIVEYVMALRRAGVVVTAGTEHNTLERIGLEPMCRGGQPLPDEVAAIFREGACVVAGHQVLSLRGETGYVDGRGELNGTYGSEEERIAAIASLGASAIGRYREASGKGERN